MKYVSVSSTVSERAATRPSQKLAKKTSWSTTAQPSSKAPSSEAGLLVQLAFPAKHRFANVDDAADVFNHSNRHFWEAMIPGLTAWGMVVCTGTNLVLRADALARVGW